MMHYYSYYYYFYIFRKSGVNRITCTGAVCYTESSDRDRRSQGRGAGEARTSPNTPQRT